MRRIVLDTETTGLSAALGDRIVEIGCVEIVNGKLTGRSFQRYLCPGRPVHPRARAVHGLSDAFLADMPRFEAVADELLDFLGDAELVIHNASFDLRFLDAEYRRMYPGYVFSGGFRVFCTLQHARRLHPGQRNGLDQLCARYGIDIGRRGLHGALLDAELLAALYLAMPEVVSA